MTSSGAKGGVDGDHDEATATALERVRAALKGLAYGSVTITVHDGVVVQVERSEKMRFEKGKKP